MGSFWEFFKKLCSIPRVVNKNLVGVVRSWAVLREDHDVFEYLVSSAVGPKGAYLDRLSDVYLNILTLTWPKFCKAMLRGKPRETASSTDTDPQSPHGCVSTIWAVPPKHGKTPQASHTGQAKSIIS